MAVQRNISVFLFGANVFVFTEIGVNIKFINGHTIITQWKTCKGVLLNGININLNEMKVSLFFVENGISYTLQLSFISRKSNGFSRKKEVYSFVINLLHWALLVQTNNWIKHGLHFVKQAMLWGELIRQCWTVTACPGT